MNTKDYNALYEEKLKRQKEILLNIQTKCIDAIQKNLNKKER